MATEKKVPMRPAPTAGNDSPKPCPDDLDVKLDEALKLTFPASDPLAVPVDPDCVPSPDAEPGKQRPVDGNRQR
jgi:hypothetical protein